jgi:DNA invertase Pin-like site-specific DNA recombinase
MQPVIGISQDIEDIHRFKRFGHASLDGFQRPGRRPLGEAPQPAFARLQRAITAGTVTTVVIWKLDRLVRRRQDGINLLTDWCARNVRVVAATQQIDLSGPVGRMVASVLFGLAEIKWEYRRERQAAGIAVAKARGGYRGRRKGTTKAKPQRAQALRQTGLTVPEIARALGIGERTVFRYLAGHASSVKRGDHS